MNDNLPQEFRNAITTSQLEAYVGEYLSCAFIRYDNSLPEFMSRDEKGEMQLRSYKVPKSFDVK